jgi:hypothetical protein
MKSIYEMMQEINFEKEAENLEKEFYSLKDEVGISKFNREQLLFYILQKFYSKFNEPNQEVNKLNIEQKKILIQECKKRVESFKYSLLDLSGCLNDCLKWGDENFYLEAEENFKVCLRKLKEAKQISEGIF